MPDEPVQTTEPEVEAPAAPEHQALTPETSVSSDPTPSVSDEPVRTGTMFAPHPGHAVIDEIVSNLKVQHNPGWIKGKLEELRKLL